MDHSDLVCEDGVERSSPYLREEVDVVKSTALLSGQEVYCDQQGREESKHKEAVAPKSGAIVMETVGDCTKQEAFCVSKEPDASDWKRTLWSYDSNVDLANMDCTALSPHYSPDDPDWKAKREGHALGSGERTFTTNDSEVPCDKSSYASMFIPKGPGVAGFCMY